MILIEQSGHLYRTRALRIDRRGHGVDPNVERRDIPPTVARQRALEAQRRRIRSDLARMSRTA